MKHMNARGSMFIVAIGAMVLGCCSCEKDGNTSKSHQDNKYDDNISMSTERDAVPSWAKEIEKKTAMPLPEVCNKREEMYERMDINRITEEEKRQYADINKKCNDIMSPDEDNVKCENLGIAAGRNIEMKIPRWNYICIITNTHDKICYTAYLIYKKTEEDHVADEWECRKIVNIIGGIIRSECKVPAIYDMSERKRVMQTIWNVVERDMGVRIEKVHVKVRTDNNKPNM